MNPYEESAAAQHEPPRWDLWLIGAIGVAGLLIIASLVSPWLRHEWSLSLGRQITPYTQLGFSDAAALPTTAVRGKDVSVSFVITNNEGKTVSYKYVVASGSGAKLESLSSATTKPVVAGASWGVATTVVPKCAASPCRIQVSLPQQGESIDFKFTYQDKNKAKSK